MPALLSITYTPNYAGNHRICFKTTQPSYCCYNDDSTSVVGVAKTTVIDLEDFELCLQDLPAEVGCAGSVVEGYVQPICIEQGSDVNRIAFTATFPSTPCNAYNIECQESGIEGITINNPGYGWPIGVVPTVTVIDSSGQGIDFAGELTMSCLPGDNFCSIGDITITNAGENYYNLNDLTVDVSPLPSCISDELIINGDFATDLSGWTLAPAPDIFIWSSGNARYNNLAYGATTPGFISQDILTPGRTYEIRIDTLALGCTAGYLQLIVSAGDFDISGTQPNQFGILRFANEPVYTTPISVTLTCVGSTSFNIFAYTTDIQNTARLDFSDVSVIEICTVVNPDLEVTALTNCGTFIVPDCDGTANPTTYELSGGPQYAVNVCSGGTGPEGLKYTITPNPTYGGEGPELVVNGNFTTDLSGWTAFPPGSEPGVFWTPQGVSWTNSDESWGITQNILTVGESYVIDITLTCDYGPTFPPPIPTNQVAFELYFGTNLLTPIYFDGTEQSFQFSNVTCVGNGTFSLLSLNTLAPGQQDVLRLCSYVSIRQIGIPTPVSCCDCVKYDVTNTALSDSFEYNYVDCLDQTIKTVTIQAQETQQVCAVVSSVWPVDLTNNQNFEYIVSGTQDC